MRFMHENVAFPYRFKKTIGRVILMEMETIKLSNIVQKLAPELYPFLKKHELESMIVLRDGVEILEHHDVVDIVHHSIAEHQKRLYLH